MHTTTASSGLTQMAPSRLSGAAKEAATAAPYEQRQHSSNGQCQHTRLRYTDAAKRELHVVEIEMVADTMTWPTRRRFRFVWKMNLRHFVSELTFLVKIWGTDKLLSTQRQPPEVTGPVRVLEMIHRAVVNIVLIPIFECLTIKFHPQAWAFGHRHCVILWFEGAALDDITNLPAQKRLTWFVNPGYSGFHV